jgi:hypothetical protein
MGIKKQAKAFHRAQLERSLKDRSTDPKTNEALKALKAYIDIRDGANQAWRALKPQLTQKDGTALKGPVAASLKEVTGLYQTRDKMAFALTQEWEHVSKVSDKIGLSLDAASIFQQSEKGEKLLLVDQYERNEMLCPFEAGKVTPFSPKLLAAVQLSEMMALDKDAGRALPSLPPNNRHHSLHNTSKVSLEESRILCALTGAPCTAIYAWNSSTGKSKESGQ